MSANNEPSPYTTDWLRGVLKESTSEVRQAPVLPPGGHHRLIAEAHGHYECVQDGPFSVAVFVPDPLRDDEIRECINEVRRIALNYGGSQQLRERLAAYLGPILRGERRP